MDKENNTNNSSKTLTDVDFYAQACSYFYYHAGQRTTMINYFIAVYGALIALYGAMLASYTLASVLTAFFMGLVSWIFYMIDIRNKFDVKESQNVIEQIERVRCRQGDRKISLWRFLKRSKRIPLIRYKKKEGLCRASQNL